jgi:IS30 family transposase
MSDFDVQSELLALKAQTQSMRKRSYSARKSRLDKYRTPLLELHKSGATGAELQRWLRTNKRIKVAHSTVLRWLEKNG